MIRGVDEVIIAKIYPQLALNDMTLLFTRLTVACRWFSGRSAHNHPIKWDALDARRVGDNH